MKRIFVLSMFICFAMICACQKQDSAAEAQLAQRKAELDTREKALDEREKALVEREKALANSRIIPVAAAGSQPRGGGSGKRKAITTAPSGASCADSEPRADELCKSLQKSGNLRFRARRPIPSRRKLKETGKYNSFLPSFRPLFLTVHCWMPEQPKEERR